MRPVFVPAPRTRPGPRARRADLPVVVHIGVHGDVPGGMAQVLAEYLTWPFEGLRVRAMASTLGRGRRSSMWRAAVCALRIPLLRLAGPPHAVVVHVSSGGSFLREGLLAAIARASGLPVGIHLHGSMLGRDAERRPRLVRAVLGRAHVVFVLSDEAARLVRASLGPDAPVRTVANGVDVPAVQSAKDPVVLFAGEVGPRKGADVLWAAWPAVAAARPGWRLLVAGPVEPEIARLPLPPATVLLGTLPRAAALTATSRAAVAVLPSRNEALPMFLLEAMARGCATVGTPVGDVARLLDGCGVLVPVGDTDALETALLRLLDDPAARAELGSAGRERVRERYSVPVLVRMFEREWGLLLGARGPAPWGEDRVG
ncbi:MAG: glycosyltransferase family 4 protein [Pseudonocardia sp.]|nr:glycosyltransferase family 4 protein [Pseudonocardia sp.]